ncbi:MAG TPA: hypothetical protein VFG03_23600, partial [Telluria sp.]|nr:hypothetical protein [Telluria sp.]
MINFPRQLRHSSGAPLLLDDSRLLLSFLRPAERAELARLLASLDLALENGDAEPAVPGETVNHSSRRFWVQARQPIHQERFDMIEKTLTPLGLDWAGPVYRLTGQGGRRALLTPLPNVILVRLRQRGLVAGPDLAAPIAAATDGGAEPVLQEVPEKSRYLNGFRYYLIANVRQVNAYQLMARIERAGNEAIADVQFETMSHCWANRVSLGLTAVGVSSGMV